MRSWIFGVLAATAALSPAKAQDVASLAATAVEGFGQALAQSMTAAPSVFVTARGRAKLPDAFSGSYVANVEGVSASAVEAAKARDDKLSRLRTIASTFGADLAPGVSRFTLQLDLEEQNRRTRETIALNAAHPGTFAPVPLKTVPKLFHAQTSVRFKAPAPAQTAAFLDAVRAAGVEDIAEDGARPGGGVGGLQFGSEFLGFGALQMIDDKVWSEAEANAVRAAQTEARALAAAAGRKVGEAKSILMLARSMSNGEAEVTVAVRYALTD